MGRLTVRLPDTLHRQLKTMANTEGISLNQYVVFALTRQITLAYTVQPMPESEVQKQKAAFTALLQGLGQASFEEIERVLGEREEVASERELTPDVVERLRGRLAEGRGEVASSG